MPDDFAKTAEQMMFDARTLRQAGAHRNACYLAGYVVECTLKVLLEKEGLTPEHTHDLESLHDKVAQLQVLGNPVVARYGDPASLAPTLLR
jgi:HEPN domain-containing protein